jgi:hypothetical protein
MTTSGPTAPGPAPGDPDTWTCPDTGKTFCTGATPTPRSRLLAAPPHIVLVAPPIQYAYVPKKRSNFGNDRYGDCVSAEEAFAKTCLNPEIDIDQLNTVCIAWARQHGVLNGAALDEVLDWMAEKGYQIGPQLYNDGPKSGVDFSNEVVLKSAIAQGPVKVAIAAGALPGGAGSQDGWYSLSTHNHRTDHSTTICGYGTAKWCYEQLNVPLPSGLTADTPGYLHYTWSTIGFVSHDWIMGTVDEAWLRNPTTLGVPPLPTPTPNPTPGPGPVPPPGPQQPIDINITANIAPGQYVLVPKITP